ncbi:galactose-3-O-sulfotransferase 3 [Betta splendens]|uniref:Galactose-3-O-sulfotransferase 3 n=1 Tax=Betta splendens TaxID=158456 RepID=A0A6P7KRP9_BETSP|nr:galactose-3-O-sulfotransferase 3 [Betta splendens]XP_028984179.1 galactose-3-O-sulfotransferase 3 [Betta splendens]XP_028984187.1 galactose-3-O-sulfotransferase 3 [Betta splendens]XP_028984195.1 galactose-3-O-sulfotransferase 3 [Betta splendens]XP_055362793.1 galactose-3-O-sulfotransferase 3 [Betta splendens]
MKMSQKKIFLVFVAISTVSLLLHHGGHLSWTFEGFHLGCPVPRSHPSPGLKPKHTNVAFLKTHKTASTTMQNLLFRFAERNNLTVALPVQACGHQFCYPRSFTSHFVHPHTLPPNIITSHMRFSKAELQRLMPNDTIHVTILREPSSMFESLFSYYNQYCQSFKRVPNGSLEAFLAEPWRYYRPDEKDAMYARNTLTFDLGGDKDRPATDVAYARAFVAEVERVFSLVMIAEYFDESLVLLRHLLSWDLDDILYVKLNMRTMSSKRSLTPGLPAKIRAWNSLDAHLYDHFNASLWRQLSALGPACVAREVRLLRQAQERLMRRCFGGRMPLLRSAAQIKNKDLRPWQPSGKVDIVGYDLPINLSNGFLSPAQELCLKLIMPEVQYTRLLLRSQSLRYRRGFQLRPPQQSHSPQQPMRSLMPRHSQVHHIQPIHVVAAGAASGTGSTSTSKTAVGNQGQTTKLGPKFSQAL